MLYWIIIAIVIAEFLLDITLRVLNAKASKNPIPRQLAGIYDEEKYKKQQAYSTANRKFGLLSTIVSSATTLSLFAFGGFAWLDSVVRDLTDSEILQTLIFFASLYLVSTMMSIPFSIYSTFVIEQKYGFNRTTPKTFVLDTLKNIVLSMLISGVIISLVVWIYSTIPDYFWIAAWGVIALIMLFFQFFYSDIIVPIFNKQKPLEEGELRQAIKSFAQKVGFRLDNIYVMDGSKRSSKANAYFTGFGGKKRVVLYDTLMEQLSTDEIVGVLAHEIGHYKKGHIVKGIVTSLLMMLITLFLFNLVIGDQAIAEAAGCSQPSFHINMMVFVFLYTPISIITGMISNILSRKHEWQADEFARTNGMGAHVSAALKKMSEKSLSNLTPHPFVVFMEYSHPTLLERVIHLEENYSESIQPTKSQPFTETNESNVFDINYEWEKYLRSYDNGRLSERQIKRILKCYGMEKEPGEENLIIYFKFKDFFSWLPLNFGKVEREFHKIVGMSIEVLIL